MVLDTRIHELGRSNAVIVICMLLRMCCNRHRSTVPDFSCSTSVVRHAKVGPFTHAEVWKVVRSDMSSCSLVLLISFVLGRGVTRVKMNDHPHQIIAETSKTVSRPHPRTVACHTGVESGL